MKTIKARVQNYRSIVDSGIVNIEDGLTILIGKNEQGKTNFLKALLSFNFEERYLPNDLPNHLRPTLEEKKPVEVPMVSLWFQLERSDIEEIGKIVPDTVSAETLKVEKSFGNEYKFALVNTAGQEKDIAQPSIAIAGEVEKIKAIAEQLKNELGNYIPRLPHLAQSWGTIKRMISNFVNSDFTDVRQTGNIVQTFSASMIGLPGQDRATQQIIASAIKEMEAVRLQIDQRVLADPRTKLKERLPRFMLHIAVIDKIPNDVPVAQFVENPEATSRGMLNLCRAAGLSIQKIRELAERGDPSGRQPYEDHYKQTVSGSLNEYWRQESYEVHFRIEKDKLSVSISDNTYKPRVSPSQRGDGFQWYLSFYAAVLSQLAFPQKVILLLDNPALELHMDGQRDIKKFLEEKFASESQIICVTHSPAFIDAFRLEQVRKVELQADNKGTRIQSQLAKTGNDFDLMEPLRSAIGCALGSSLIINKYNILVEGASDKDMLDGAFLKFKREVVDDIIVNGSVAESADCLLPRFYHNQRIPFVVLLDQDSRGRDIAKSLKQHGIPDKSIILLGEVFGERKDEYSMEDLFNEDYYHRAVLETYSNISIEKPESKGSKIAKAYESLFRSMGGIKFNKKRVAATLKRMLTQDEDIDSGTKDNLDKLLDFLMERLLDISRG